MTLKNTRREAFLYQKANEVVQILLRYISVVGVNLIYLFLEVIVVSKGVCQSLSDLFKVLPFCNYGFGNSIYHCTVLLRSTLAHVQFFLQLDKPFLNVTDAILLKILVQNRFKVTDTILENTDAVQKSCIYVNLNRILHNEVVDVYFF